MKKELLKIKEEVINKIVVMSAIFFVLPYLLSLLRWFDIGWQDIYVLHTLIYFSTLGLAVFRNKINYFSKTIAISIIYLSISIIGLIKFGLNGGFYFAIMSLAIIATLTKRKFAIYVSVGVVLLFSLVAIGFSTYMLKPGVDLNLLVHSPLHWFLTIVSIFSIILIFIFAFGDFYRNLTKTIEEKEKATASLLLQNKLLETSEKKHQALFDSANDAILILKDNFFVDCNKKACEYFKLDKEELLGKKVAELSSEFQYDGQKSSEKGDQIISEVLSGHSLQFEWQHIRSNGEPFDTSISLNRITIQGEVFIQSVIRDITEKKKTEEALRKSKNRYKNLFENSADGILVLNEQSEILELNNKICEILDCTREDLILLKGYEFIHPDDLANKDHAGALVQLMQGKTLITQYRLRKKDGTYIPTELSTKMIGEGQFLNIVRDIRERIDAEKKIQESEIKYRSFFENSMDAILLTSTDGKIHSANPAACAMFECTEEEIIQLGRAGVTDVLDPRLPILMAIRAEKGKASGEITMLRKNGSPFEAEISSAIFENADKIQFSSMIIRDISERKKAEKDLVESEKLLSVVFNYHSDLQLLTSIKNDEYTVDAINNPYISTLASLGIIVTKEELIGKSLRHLNKVIGLNDDYYDTTIEKYKEIARTGKSINFTEKIDIANQIYTSKVTITPIVNDYGQCEYILYNSQNITEATLANSALQESEEKFKQIFLTSPDIVTISQIEDGTYLDINDRFIQRFGHPREEIIGKTSIDLNIWTREEDRERMLAQLTEFGKVENMEANFQLKDGTIIECLMSASILLIKNKPHLLTITRDISELKQAEKLSSESQYKLHSALNSMTDAVFISDVNGNFIDFNEAFGTFHKFATKEDCVKTFAEYQDTLNVYFSNGALAPVDMWAVPRALRGETATNVGYSMRRKDTGETWVGSFSFSPIRDENNEIVGSVVVGRDITEIKKAEIALNESNDRLKLILENTPIAIWDWDLKTDKWFATSNYYTMLGYENENTIPDRSIWLNRVHPDYREVVSKQITGILDQSNDSYCYEAPMLHADGSYKWHSVIGQVIEFDENNHAKRLIGVRIDVNEQKLAEEAYKETAANMRSMIDNREDFIWSIDRDLNYILFNSSYEEAINKHYNIKIAKGSSSVSHVPTERTDFWIPLFEKVFKGESITFENLTTLKGEMRYFQNSLNPIVEDNLVTGVSGLTIDITERKLVEKALKLSEEKFEKAFRLVPFLITLTEMDGQVAEVNDRIFDTFGYTREEFLTSNTTQIELWVDPNEREKYGTLLKQHGNLHQVEVKFRKKSGEINDYLLSACLIEVNERKLYLSIIHDITERKQKEKALRESEERYRDLFENSYAIMLLIDPENGNIVGANPAASTFYGWSNLELTSMNISQINHKTNKEIKTILNQASKNDQNHFLFEHVLADNSIRNVEAYSAPIFIDGKKILYSIVHDVTDRKKMEIALVNEKNLLSAIIENIPVMLTRFDPETNLLYLNKEFEEKIGWKTQDLETINLMEKVYPDPAYRAETMAYMQSLSNNWKEFHVNTKDGAQLDSEWRNIRLEDGTQIGIGIDITEEKKIKAEILTLNAELENKVKLRTAQLEAINKELQTFTYSVSHDLKAPLRGIDGYSKLLADIYKTELDPEAQSFIQKIRTSTLQMNQIIDDLLDYSRLERSQLNIGTLKIKDLVQSVLSIYTAALETDHFTINTKIADIEITADSKGFIIALRNLIENSIKFTKARPKPTINIEAIETELSWIISVNDNGIGFDMQYHHKIFDIFQRLQRAEDYPGTGIGLALVSKAMQRMNGKAWAESVQNVGSTFYLEIPKNQ